MRVLIVGPGRIGCGYLAPLFHAAGWEVVLAARTERTAERINGTRRLAVRVTGTSRERGGAAGAALVDGIRAVAAGSCAFAQTVAGADLVCTAVGVTNVPALAAPLAQALGARPAHRPVDVWVVENADCAPALERDVVRAASAAGLELPPVGFAGAVAKVAVARGTWTEEGVPTFVGDAARLLWVDERRTRTPIPRLPGVRGSSDYPARLAEKLYVFNAGHAIAAYLGWLARRETIAQAATDPCLRPLLAGCLLESRRAVLAAHPSLGHEVDGPVAEVLERFLDRELADPVERVAREPIRKLAPADRLLGPAELIRRTTGSLPAYFALGAAGALLYRVESDEQSMRLRDALVARGVMDVLADVCGLDPDDELARAIAARYRRFVITEEGAVFPPVHAPPEPRARELVGAAA